MMPCCVLYVVYNSLHLCFLSFFLPSKVQSHQSISYLYMIQYDLPLQSFPPPAFLRVQASTSQSQVYQSHHISSPIRVPALSCLQYHQPRPPRPGEALPGSSPRVLTHGQCTPGRVSSSPSYYVVHPSGRARRRPMMLIPTLRAKSGCMKGRPMSPTRLLGCAYSVSTEFTIRRQRKSYPPTACGPGLTCKLSFSLKGKSRWMYLVQQQSWLFLFFFSFLRLTGPHFPYKQANKPDRRAQSNPIPLSITKHNPSALCHSSQIPPSRSYPYLSPSASSSQLPTSPTPLKNCAAQCSTTLQYAHCYRNRDEESHPPERRDAAWEVYDRACPSITYFLS